MNLKNKKNYAVVVFYIMAVVVRYLTNKTGLLANIDNSFVKIILQGISPTVGVIVASLIFGIKFYPMTLNGNYKRFLFPLSVYWVLPVLLIAGNAFITKNSFPVLSIMAFFIYGLLEEIGWRGFLQQQLKDLPKIWNILIVGVLWFIWHLNFEISAMNLLFLALLIFGSWGIGVVADKTHSLLAVSAFHTLNNLKTENNWMIILTLLLVWIILIVYMSEKKKQKSAQIR